MENTLKQKLAAGAQPIGTFFDTASVSLMECLGRTGLDFAIIDNEHSPIEAETTAALVRAAELSGICPLARVREISRPAVLKLLDVGVQGLIEIIVGCAVGGVLARAVASFLGHRAPAKAE